MHRHVTDSLLMLTDEGCDGERRTVDLLTLDDGREAAVLRHHTPAYVASWHITEDEDRDADLHVALFPDLYDMRRDDIIDWTMPREAAIAFILTFIAAIR